LKWLAQLLETHRPLPPTRIELRRRGSWALSANDSLMEITTYVRSIIRRCACTFDAALHGPSHQRIGIRASIHRGTYE